MSNTPFRWGILGPGKIAHKFAKAITALPDAALQAVGSRSMARSTEFAEKYSAKSAYGSYEELAADDNVDAIYIATPHPLHCENTLLCLNHNKPVLCEKPFSINARETKAMIASARKNKVFLMEAMWTRFFPLVSEIKEIISSGGIGEPRMILADFSYRSNFDPESRLFNRDLGGGGLLDVGVYPISLASYLFGDPVQVAGVAEVGKSGIDEQAAFVLKYSNNVIASLTCAVSTDHTRSALIIGVDGTIEIPSPFWIPTSITINCKGKEPEILSRPNLTNGYEYEAIETALRVRNSELESPIMSLAETLAIMETMDTLRSQFGLTYPADEN